MKHSTAVSDSFVVEFRQNPLNFRVLLPDGSLAVVREFIDDDGQRLHRVQGITRRGRFCKLPRGVCRWYTAAELRLVYYMAGINPAWGRS